LVLTLHAVRYPSKRQRQGLHRKYHCSMGDSIGNSHSDVIGKIATNDSATTAAGDFMDASNVGEIAWCATQGSIDGGGGFIEVVDPENLIVEDAYIYTRHGGTTGPVNYMVTFEKYEFSTWRGALAMANERASNE
jgi:hypothetical protein